MDSSTLSLDTNLSMMMKERYFRLNQSFDIQIAMDDAKGMDTLINRANSMNLDACFSWIENVFYGVDK